MSGSNGNERERDEHLMRQLLLVRKFEEALVDLYHRGELPGGVHLCLGQEAAAVGACAALQSDDKIITNFRSHGHALAKGSDPARIMAEIMARSTGLCGGKGGSVHFNDPSVGLIGSSGIVGSQIPVGAGVALAQQVLGRPRVALVFFGDGAAGEGVLYEAMNLAGVWNLPVVFFCENNQFVATVRSEVTVAGGDIASRGHGFGMPSVAVDGQDVLAVRGAVTAAAERARRGDGPSFIEAKTYRFTEHAVGMKTYKFETVRQEADHWINNRDPLSLFAADCAARGTLTPSDVDTIAAEVTERIAAAVDFALQSPVPNLEDAFAGLYATT